MIDQVQSPLLTAEETAIGVQITDPIEGGKMLEQTTAVLAFHIHKPGFIKPIPPAEFIRKIKAAGEESLTPEQEQLLASYKASVTETVGSNGEKTDTTMLHISQDILDRAEIAKIVNYDDKFSAWIKSISIPCPIKFQGAYLLSLKRTDEVDAAIKNFRRNRRKLIHAFRDKYLELKEQAKGRRWPFYDEADYPEWSKIEMRYTVEADWLSFNVPAAMEKVNSQIYAEAQRRSALHWASAYEEAQIAQRALFQDLLESFTTMLGRDDKGKRKTFRPTAVKKLKDFLAMWNEINLTGDVELSKVIATTQQVVEGMDPEKLKKDGTLRDTMETSFRAIKEQAASLITVRERKVVFDDFDEEEEAAPEAAPTPLSMEANELLEMQDEGVLTPEGEAELDAILADDVLPLN